MTTLDSTPSPTTTAVPDLAERIRRLEDRVAISERVISYARAIDSMDWDALAGCLTDPVHIDFSEAGVAAADFPREAFVGFAGAGLGGFTALQHLSPNHIIEFDDVDPDRAVCRSSMHAQHHLAGAEGGEALLMRGSYTNSMVRTSDGWRIERLVQHVSWTDGNTDLPAQAAARTASQPGGADPPAEATAAAAQ